MTKSSVKEGDFVEIIIDEEPYKGIIMPSKQKDIISLKLESGYNLNLKKSKIKSMRYLEKINKISEKKQMVPINKLLPKISILHTGGTIASKVDYKTGAVISKFTPEEILSTYPELRDMANISSRFISNMWSEDMRFSHYNILAKEVQKELKNSPKGIIISHGTDTLHYSSAALAFILQGINIPVIIVGAQRSSDRGSSDAFLNLACAIKFIIKTDLTGIAICMHENENDESCLILSALKSRKLHTSRRDAFKPVNSKPIARINLKGDINMLSNYPKNQNSSLNLKFFKENLKIGILKSHPNIFSKEISQYKGYDGLILEGTGLGHFPISVTDSYTKEHKNIFNELKKLAKNIPVVMTSQTIFGRVNMNVYSSGRELQEIGILGNLNDMTPETAFIKLAWLLSNYSKKEVREMISKNLIGEISERTNKEFEI